MSKLNSQSDQISKAVMKQCTPGEYMVFMAWFSDSTNWNATHIEIQERTNLEITYISRAFKSLISKGILAKTTKVKRSQNYELTDTFLDTVQGTTSPVTKDVQPSSPKKEEVIEKQPTQRTKEWHMAEAAKAFAHKNNDVTVDFGSL